MHQRTMWLAAALLAANLLAACGGGGNEPATAAAKSAAVPPASPSPVETYSPAGPPRPEAAPRAQASRAALASAPRFALPALPETAKALAAAAPEAGRRQVATGRDVAGAADAAAFSARLQWKAAAGGGQQAVVLLSSEGAAGLRAGVRIEQLPEGASLRFFAPGATDDYRVPAGGAAAGQLVWSPYLAGDQLALEVNLPAGADASAVRIAVPRLSHFTRSPVAARDGQETTRIGEGASCNVDASCYATASPEINAVARILFTAADGGSYLCSGTLLADRQGSRTPYFLTANHCISTAAEAATLQSFWFYRSASCNGFTLSQQSITRTGGATLLYASELTDSSFMVLNQPPPDGVAFAGWLPSADITTAAMTGLHHPHGDLLKAAFGSFRTYKSCGASSSGILNCSNSSAGTSNFFDVLLGTGTMESGSSGSGVFATPPGSASKYLAGQLYGGSSSCSNRSGTNIYGRFDRTYQAVSGWLEAGGDVLPQSGVWWNPAESGRGFVLDRQGEKLALGGYMFETGGVATWYLSVMTKRANGTYAGELLRYAGGQTLTGTYRPPQFNTKVADVVFVFTSPTQGRLMVQPPGGIASTIELTRFVASTATPVLTVENGVWWNPAENGRGYLIEVQGSQVYVSVYTYEASGQPTWYLSVANVQDGQPAAGQLQQYINGQSLQGTYRAPGMAGSPGSVRVQFNSPTSANLTLPNGQVIPISRFTF